MIRADKKNPKARELAAFLESRHVDEMIPVDLCLVLGGDGTMLRTIREIGSTMRFLGINCGRVGFLMNDLDNWDALAQRLVENEWSFHSFPRLAMQALMPGIPSEDIPDAHHGSRASLITGSGLAINDVYVERMTAQSCNLRVAIDGSRVVDRMTCDGLVISTAIGSTGYGLAAGGPACHARVRAMLVTPICPHRPRLMPIIVPPGSRIEVWPLDTHRRPVRAVADGVDFRSISHLLVNDAKSDVEIAFFEGYDFTEAMFRKVLL